MVSVQEMEFYCAVTTGNLSVVDRFLTRYEEQQQRGSNGSANNNDNAQEQPPQQFTLAAQSFAGHSVLHGACNVHKGNGSTTVQALLARPAIRDACLNLRDLRHHRTPLQTCLVVGHDDLALLLLQQDDINVSNRDDDDRTALHLACFGNRSLRVIQVLIQKCNQVDSRLIHQPDKYGKTPLLYACDHANLPVVQQLLSTMPTTAVEGTTSLSSSSPPCWEWELSHVRGALEIPVYQTVARIVLNAGFTIRPILRSKHPFKIHKELLAWMQHLQADPVQQLRTAAAQGNLVALQQSLLLIMSSSSANSPQPKSEPTTACRKAVLSSALYGAARYGHAAGVGLLMDAGASLWMVHNENGMTPVQIAVQYGHLNVVEEILRHTVV